MSDDAFLPGLAGSILNVVQYVVIVNLRDVVKLSETPRVIFKRILFLRGMYMYPSLEFFDLRGG